MNKISIIGGSGTGKTTLSNNLSKELNIVAIHLDGINYFEKWSPRDKIERDNIILEKIKEPKWIIDGTYTSTLKERIEESDLIIYLDYSSFCQIKGVLKRNFALKGKVRPEIPGCNEKLDFKFLIWVLKWRKNKREKIIGMLSKIDKEKVLIFKSQKELNKWYKEKFNKNISIEY